ncbi:MAG: glycerol-3-phosphate acyltransferase, partial [Bacteroidota bacterium]
VDRRKKNPIYRQTLNSYSTVAIRNGAHSLFFPGGTRSRSGEIEKKLKLGLLGTAMEAQRRNLLHPPSNHSGKIFVVPLVMSYHFVLEAASLIKQHLKRTGQEQYYILDKESASYLKFLKFVWTTFSKQSEINLSFGRPMDVFGNFVDEEGRSLDPYGREVDIKAYFEVGGQITEDKQRDEVYTKMLGETISERFHVENRVFSSHLVAYVGFEMFRKRFPNLDLYGILRLLEDERKLNRAEFTENVERVLNRLRELTDKGKVHLAGHMNNDVPHIIEHGISNLGLYHDKRPLSLVDHESLQTENMNLLYFYHNRLEGYELASYVQ